MNSIQVALIVIGGFLILLAVLDWYTQSYRCQSWQSVTGKVTDAKMLEDSQGRVYLLVPFWHPEITYKYDVEEKTHFGTYTEHPNLEKERIGETIKSFQKNPSIELVVNPNNANESMPILFINRYSWAQGVMALGGLIFIALSQLIK